MATLLALLSALSYGVSDFLGGLASRRVPSAQVAAGAQVCSLLLVAVTAVALGRHGPSGSALGWGALSGLGSATGGLALYQGLAVGRMSVVATVSGVLAAVLPVAVGIAVGNQLSAVTTAGIVLAIPAIGLVSWQPSAPTASDEERTRTGAGYGVVAGLGFGLLFVALDRAGTGAGAWPALAGQTLGLALLVAVAVVTASTRTDRRPRARIRPRRRTVATVAGAGLLSGTANLLFLAATGHGELAIVAVLGALYPAATVLMARLLLHERWTRLQAVGLAIAPIAVVLVTVG